MSEAICKCPQECGCRVGLLLQHMDAVQRNFEQQCTFILEGLQQLLDD